MQVSAVKLVRLGNDVVVSIETRGKWVEVIREQYDACFSHIVEERGMEEAEINAACDFSIRDKLQA